MPQYDESHRAMNTDTPRTQEAAREDVCIGMVAGFPSAAQYYAAAQQAVDRDNDIERCESPKRSDTPMTDANCWSQDADIYRGEIINSNFARRLERELNAANAIIKACISAMPVGNLATHTPDNLAARIGELAKSLAVESIACEDAEKDAAALSEALSGMTAQYGCHCGHPACRDDWRTKDAEEALAAHEARITKEKS
jgi:hypothetical protein